MPGRRLGSGALIALVSLAWCGTASAQTSAVAPAGGPTKSPPGATVYFIDVKDGDVLPPKATIHFGLRGMGVAPAGSERDNSGHHHLLIDAETPPLNVEIPNDFQHLHFGAGQTEAEVTLAPGEHTLQLVFADRNHVPHSPPVMSPRIKVRVADTAGATAGGPAKRHASAKDAKVYFVYPRNGAYLPPQAVIRFGLINMGVAPAGFEKANTGHHHLIVDAPLPPLDRPIPNDFQHLHFGAGQTEAKITLPLGEHTLQLLLADDAHVPHDPALYSAPIKVTVNSTGRRPRPFRQRRYYR